MFHPKSADKEHMDVFLGPDLKSPLVFIVDQVDPATRKFDEHKIILGTTSKAEAEKLYLSCYEKGWKGVGGITMMFMPAFKKWLKHGDTGKAVKKAFEIPAGLMMVADDIPLSIMRWWRNRDQPKAEGSKFAPPVPTRNPLDKTAADKLTATKALLGAALGGTVGNIAGIPGRQKAEQQYGEARQKGAKPGLLHPRAPRGSDLLTTQNQGERYIRGNKLNPSGNLAAEIRHMLSTPNHGGAFLEEGAKGRPLLLVPKGETTAVLKHEIGHARAAKEVGRSYGASRLTSQLRAILTGPRRTPLYRLEEDAWNRGGVSKDDPMRQAALETYESGINQGAYAGRGMLGGAAVGAGSGKIIKALKGVVKSAGAVEAAKLLIFNALRKPTSPKGEQLMGSWLSGKVRKGTRSAAQSFRKNPDEAVATAVGAIATLPVPVPGASLAGGAITGGGYRGLKRLVQRFTRPALAPADVAAIKKSAALERVRLNFMQDGQVKTSADVEVADTPGARARGLMYRESLEPGQGMFFDKAGSYWMKNVSFPLDILFLDADGVIVEKQAMMPAGDDPEVYSPGKQAEHALELPHGWFDECGLKVGDRIAPSVIPEKE